MKRWHILLGSASLLVLSAASACGDSSSDAGGAGGSADVTATGTGAKTVTGTGASTKAATTGANNGSTSPATGSTATGATACGMLATYGECVGCFCEANEAGCASYFAFEDAACLCDMGAPCATDCGTTYCTGDEFMGACETCYNGLTGMEMCFETAFTSCQADATCNAYLMAEDAECGALPE